MGNNILCIEDNPDNMMLLKRVLESAGYCLRQATNGLDGITIAETDAIDLILLDINLPDIDGYEVARRLRQSPKEALNRIPIIVITANALKGDAQKALSAGATAYMTKPIDIHELWTQVATYISKPK
jgi:two-component system, cell cycle response regulator DivK